MAGVVGKWCLAGCDQPVTVLASQAKHQGNLICPDISMIQTGEKGVGSPDLRFIDLRRLSLKLKTVPGRKPGAGIGSGTE